MINLLRTIANHILPDGARLALYGSRARGDNRPDSDWDIHILVPGEEKLPLSAWDSFAWPFADEALKIGEIVNPRLYSFAGWNKRNFLPFYKNVEADKILILQK